METLTLAGLLALLANHYTTRDAQGSYGVMGMNPKASQQRDTPDAGQRKIIGQRQGSNSSVKILLLLIYKIRKAACERLPWL